MRPASLLLILVCAFPLGLQAEEVDTADSLTNARQLIETLGDSEFSVREQASVRLIDMGLDALQALEEGARHPDREIRYRCERILVVVRDYDFRRRLELFANDRNGERDYDLPCWEKFRAVVGEDAAARELFVEMQRNEPDLLQLAAQRPDSIAGLLQERCQQIQQAMQLRQQPDAGSVAAMLLLAGDDNVTLDDQTSQLLYSYVYQAAAFRGGLEGGPRKKEYSKLLGGFLLQGNTSWTAYQTFQMAMRYDLKEGLVPAKKVIEAVGVQPQIRQYAALTVAKLGDESHYPLLEQLFEDETVCFPAQKGTFQIELRDVALCCLVHLAGLNHKEYGFNKVQPNPQMLFNINTTGFDNEQARTDAFAKWKAYRESREEKKE